MLGHVNRTNQDEAKYKKFQSAVEKTLLSFDQVAEWADFITFLAKLLKTLQTYPHFQSIPHRLTVAKRLSQCLNPALPTGVHQRALDVYVHILNTIGPEQLKKDLSTWSSGLFPFFQFAATSVRPIVLGIYSKFYLPLQDSLRPCMRAFILALLPGVEEETSEFFDKVSSLLDQLSGCVNPPFFFQHLWLVMLTAPNVRISALNYLSRRLPTIQTQDPLAPIVGPDLGLMVRGLAATLEDPRILVQRAVLDLLTSTLHLNGTGMQKEIQRNDQLRLMKSCIAVVLKRDLSLSRRLYTWLLGKHEASDKQVLFLKEHGLALLVETIKADMANAATATDLAERQRPFKIFLSLLDKWEIGSSLTEAMVLDVLEALERMLDSDDSLDDLHATANMLFEALDPFLTWKALFGAVSVELKGGETQSKGLRLTLFVVRHFRFEDTELLKLHVPMLAYSVLDLLEDFIHSSEAAKQPDKTLQAIQLVQDLLREITPDFYAQAAGSQPKVSKKAGLKMATDFYNTTSISAAQLLDASAGPFLRINGLASLLKTAEHIARSSKQLTDQQFDTLAATMDTTSLILTSRGALDLPDWDPSAWLTSLLDALRNPPATASAFLALNAVIQTASELSRYAITPRLELDRLPVLNALLESLLFYMQPQLAACHSESVRLLWLVQSLSHYNLIESLLSARMCSTDPQVKTAAYEAFGVIWRLSEDEDLPTEQLSAPLFIVLDAFRDSDVFDHTLAEAWMRCSFRSYARLIDPILSILTNIFLPTEQQQLLYNQTLKLKLYTEGFDQSRVCYALGMLHYLFVNRGAGFHRAAKSSIYKSTKPNNAPATRRIGPNNSYLDVICDILIDLLLSDPAPELEESMAVLNQNTHLAATDTLLVIIQRGEVEETLLPRIEYAILARLLKCINSNAVEMQNRLLHTLHAILQTRQASHKRRQSAQRSSIETVAASEKGDPHVDSLLCATLTEGIARQQNTASLHYWIDFLFMSLSHLRSKLDTLVYPLLNNFILRLSGIVKDLRQVYDPVSKGKGVLRSSISEMDFVALAGALERLLLFAVEDAKIDGMDLPASKTSEKPPAQNETSGGFLTYVTGAFSGSETPSSTTEELRAKSEIVSQVEKAVSLLFDAWDASTALELSEVGAQAELSQAFIMSRINTRTRKSLERLYKTLPTEVIEVAILRWHDVEVSDDDDKAEQLLRLIKIIDLLTPSASKVVSSACDLINIRTKATSSTTLNPDLTDTAIFRFIESYISQLEGPMAVQVWSTLLTFARDVLTSSNKYHLLPSLRLITVVGIKIASTSALEDRRLRRDLQDIFTKLLDGTLAYGGRTGHGLRRVSSQSSLSNSMVVDSTTTNGDMAADPLSQTQLLPTSTARPVPAFKELAEFLATHVLPNLKRFLLDNDRIAAISSSVLQNCLAPSFNKRSRAFDVDPAIFQLLTALTHQTSTATVRVWRGPVTDWFQDARFFNASPQFAGLWKPIVLSLISTDKDRFLELINRISTTSSAASLFTNRELENLTRALNLRRLAYVLLISEKDRWLTMLPAIQEKLVEVLRANVGEIVHAEVYLCLRILLCRIREQHLTSLWPIVLTEMLRLFETLLEERISASPEYLQLILAACKFLDLLLVLQTEDFQIHEWIFITDTTDALYPPEHWEASAVMDRIGSILERAPSNEQTHTLPSAPASSPRRPLLNHLRQNEKLDSLAVLEPFFASVSRASFEATYSANVVDWGAVVAGIDSDMFEGAL